MADKEQEKKELEIDSLEVTELEDGELEDVAGGNKDTSNSGCPTNTNCPC